ncbi:MAG: dual specificity protein phosphatase family protein [Nannocystaceae bacterium]
MAHHPALAPFTALTAAVLGSSACYYSTVDFSHGSGTEVTDTIEVGEADLAQFPGFSWVVPQVLAGMPTPAGGHGLLSNFAFLADHGIDTLVSLTPYPPEAAVVEAYGMQLLHFPVADFAAPTQDQLRSFVSSTQRSVAQQSAVAVHCMAGRGRTGTFLAAYFVGEGMSADQALAHVRALRPGSVESLVQEEAVRLFFQSLRPPRCIHTTSRCDAATDHL